MRPWRMVGATRRALVRDQLRSALHEWGADWGPVGDADIAEWLPAGDLPAGERPDAGWISVSAGALCVHLWIQPAPPVAFAAMTLHAAAAAQSSLWGEVVRASLIDLGARFLHSGADDPAASTDAVPAPAIWARGSGALVGRVSLPCAQLLLVCDDALVRHLSARAVLHTAPLPALENPLLGIQSGSVTISFQLGEAELSIAALDALAVGDLITLPTELSELLEVHVDGLPTNMRAYPGRIGSRLAMRLLAAGA